MAVATKKVGQPFSMEYQQLFALYILINSLGSLATCAHSQNYGCSTCHSITAGEYALA